MICKPTLAIYGIQDRADLPYPWYVHDHNFTFMSNGKVEKYLQLERASRNKHDNTLHKQLKSILKDENLIGGDKDIVFVDNVVGRSFISSCGSVRFETSVTEKLADSAELGKCWWFDREQEAYMVNHELAHIYSCVPFFGDFKNNSLLIHFDGGASKSNFSAWFFQDGKLQLLEYNWDLKRISSLYNANALSFAMVGAKKHEQNAVAGKLMGLAAYGAHSSKLEEWLAKNNYFADIWKNKSLFFNAVNEDWGVDIKNIDTQNKFIQNIAATIQHVFSRELISTIERLQIETGADHLYYSGGSALNIVANTKLFNKNIFKDIYIPPCPGDSGLSLGAAAFIEQVKGNNIEIVSPFINNVGVEDSPISFDSIPRIAQLISEGYILGLCNGNAEAGPRALGNRSIIAIPSSKSIAEKVSREVKRREWYRPIAPIMLAKNVKKYTGLDVIPEQSRFMLSEFNILPHLQSDIEGVVHVNGTSRIQTIFTRDDNPFIYDLLTYLDENFNIPAIINTSFNIKGEPIVHTVENAIDSGKNMQLDAVVVNGILSL